MTTILQNSEDMMELRDYDGNIIPISSCSHPKFTKKSKLLGQCVHCRGEQLQQIEKHTGFYAEKIEDLLKISRNNPRWDN